MLQDQRISNRHFNMGLPKKEAETRNEMEATWLSPLLLQSKATSPFLYHLAFNQWYREKLIHF